MSAAHQLPMLRRYLVWLALREDVGVSSVYRGEYAGQAAREYVEELVSIDCEELRDVQAKGERLLVATVDERIQEPELVELTCGRDGVSAWYPPHAMRQAFAACWYFGALGIWAETARPRSERPQRKAG